MEFERRRHLSLLRTIRNVNLLVSASCLLVVIVNALLLFEELFSLLKRSNEVYCCRIYFVNYIQTSI